MSEFDRHESSAVLNILRKLENRIYQVPAEYVSSISFEIGALFNKFYPQQIENYLRTLRSSKFLIAVPLESVRLVEPELDLIAVLPQTDFKEYPFGLGAFIEQSPGEFEANILNSVGMNYRLNFARLSQTGVLIKRPSDPNIRVIDVFRQNKSGFIGGK